MGTWGTGSFENDQALDWVGNLGDQGAGLIEESLGAEPGAEYLDADIACDAIAAAEAIAALSGKPAANLPEELTEWIAAHRAEVDAERHRAKALALVQRVLADASELRDLWAENEEDAPAWRAGVEDLIQRLRG